MGDLRMMSSGRPDLPADLTSFVGRRRETADIRRTLERSRLVTLTGIAGVGKTRVALKAAESMRRAFADGVLFVELSSLADPERLAQVIARELEIPDQSASSSADMLARYLADRQLLLVLDTCEHLVESCSRLVGGLLAAARGLRVLATSRQPLGAPGEHCLVIRPMAVPEPGQAASLEELADCESVVLFRDRVATVDPGFELTEQNAPAVAELCRRLGGIPLALELAAVRARSLPVERILTLLDERFWLAEEDASAGDPRHRTMQAAIAWSHGLCTAEERLLWTGLSIFPGRFDLPAAEAVCAQDGLPAHAIYPAIDGLVAKSILVCSKGPGRTTYRMPDSLREFGADQMPGPDQRRALLARHRDHYAELAVAASAVPPRGDQAEEWKQVRAEWPNLRAALEFCAADPAETAEGVRLVISLTFLWIACGMGREGRHYMEWFVGVARLDGVTRVQLLLLLAYAMVAQGDLRSSRETLEECAEVVQHLDDPLSRTHLVKMRGTLAYAEGDLAAADANLTEAIGLLHNGQSDLLVLAAMVELGITRLWLDRIDEAAEVLRECKRECEESGQSWARSWADLGLSLVLRATGELPGALALARSALRTQRRLHDASGASLCLELVAWLATGQEDPVWVTRLLHAAHGQWRQVRRPLYGSPHFLAEHARCEERLRRAIPPAEYEEAAAEGSAMSMDEAIAYALDESAGVQVAAPRDRAAPLSPRELEVADLVADGLTNKEIAQRLVVGRRTIDTHVEHILAKLDFSSRSQIAAWAIRHREGGGGWPSDGTAISQRK
ncbi:LuxR C-terminal-related transcriptional regulator [Spongiactinospora sp. TRM90649]|uniref:ATP-binding protein n=1 Tax=Spongiactinospora sp. TRM90649 TaxID=3031114 RepID=UPI0023F8B693|nr:LuxR C-terminal-related transcriptional regulator [Spongiactinospora sp. TRM90649]MDF5756814.1 LuxR C-terminal-related transcriptional regulator [Spongiactinospora sp. TRM90649]